MIRDEALGELRKATGAFARFGAEIGLVSGSRERWGFFCWPLMGARGALGY